MPTYPRARKTAMLTQMYLYYITRYDTLSSVKRGRIKVEIAFLYDNRRSLLQNIILEEGSLRVKINCNSYETSFYPSAPFYLLVMCL
jgi:ASC-1-like (ASCH) protein